MGGAIVRPLLNVLESQRTSIGTIALAMLDVGGYEFNSSWLVKRFRQRVGGKTQGLSELARGNPRDEAWLNHPGATMRNPENNLGVCDHYARSRPGIARRGCSRSCACDSAFPLAVRNQAAI